MSMQIIDLGMDDAMRSAFARVITDPRTRPVQFPALSAFVVAQTVRFALPALENMHTQEHAASLKQRLLSLFPDFREDFGDPELTAFIEALEDRPDVELPLTRWDAWTLIGCVQIASRDPDYMEGGEEGAADIAIGTARQLMEACAPPAFPEPLYRLLQSGWDPDCDMPAEEGLPC